MTVMKWKTDVGSTSSLKRMMLSATLLRVQSFTSWDFYHLFQKLEW